MWFSESGEKHVQAEMTKKLILFDIDGTLIVSGGAGARAMTRAFEETWGLSDALRHVDVAGRTDNIILEDALRATGIVAAGEPLERFKRIYCEFLRDELSSANGVAYGNSTGNGRPKCVLPGIQPLLEALLARQDVSLALLTGNFPESAEIKLRHFDLWEYFEWGVYGNEATDRHDLLPIALQRHLDRGAPSIDPADVIIVGDTPHDISCAHRGGAKAIAVATGNYTLDVLSGCRPDVLVQDLTDHAPFFALLDRKF
jgi:phosphoglycolate phosphatase-like HAD superfamily hydrolase